MLAGSPPPCSIRHEPLVSSKYHDVRLDGEPQDSSRSPPAARLVDRRDQLAKRQPLLLGMRFH